LDKLTVFYAKDGGDTLITGGEGGWGSVVNRISKILVDFSVAYVGISVQTFSVIRLLKI